VVLNGFWRSGVMKIVGRVVNLGILIKRTKKKVENDNFNENALATWLSACYPGGVCENFRATVQAFIHSLNARVKNHQ